MNLEEELAAIETAQRPTGGGLAPIVTPTNGRRLPTPTPSKHGAPIPPQHPEAEEHVLGAMMLTANAIAAVSEILGPGDFYRPSNGVIYQAALNLYNRNEPVDYVTLERELEQGGNLDKAGGKLRVREIANLVPSSPNAPHYARIVHEAATLRGLIDAGGRIAQLGHDREGEPAELVDHAGELVYQLAHRVTGRTGTEHINAPLTRVFDELREAQENGGRRAGLATGFRDLDQICAGLKPANLIVLAARPGMGKSALAHAIAANVALKQETPVALFSLEMSKTEVVQRLLSRTSRTPLHKLVNGHLNGTEIVQVANAAGPLSQSPLHLDDRSALSLHEIRAELRRREYGLVIVDYLQLIKPPAEAAKRSRNDEVGAISRGLKALAKDFHVPVIALAQLNRNVEQRNDKHPTLSDLRDSGEIEQDADIILFLYRGGYYKDQTAGDIAEIDLAKNRNGPVDDCRLHWDKRYATFGDLEQNTPGVF